MPKICALAIIQHGPNQKYAPIRHLQMGSVQGRIAEIGEAIKAADSLTAKRLPEVKIAICPEFYLSKQHGHRKQSNDTADVFHTISEVIDVLKALKKLSDRFPNWLIIPGTVTVIGLDEVPAERMTRQILVGRVNLHRTDKVSEDASFSNQTLSKYKTLRLSQMRQAKGSKFKPCYNLSPIYHNGRIVMIRRKKLEAVADMESLDRVGSGKDSLYFPLIANSSILVHGGLRIGIEICSEHEYGSLFQEAQTSGLLDLHIVISTEVYPFREHSATHKKGMFIHAGTSTTGFYKHGELPTSLKSYDFEYQRFKKPGEHIWVGSVGA